MLIKMMEQHANLIMAEKLQTEEMDLKETCKYELLDGQLQQLVSSFHLITRDIYFNRARTLLNCP